MTILHTDEQRLALLVNEREWRMTRIKSEQEIIAALNADILAISDRRLRAELGVSRHNDQHEVGR